MKKKICGDIVFDHVKKTYGKNVVIPDLNLTIRTGERTILLGPSGCGKTTTLRMISGLEEISEGNLYMGDTVVNDIASGDRNIAMVFQNYALFPHMTVFKNIAFGLRTYNLPKDEIRKRVSEIIHILELDGLEERLPRELSGGQRQRVALARAAVKKAEYFLLDEPLSNLDAQLRTAARKELVKLHEMYGPTFIYVTHDQIEAMTIGQRIILMNKGKIQMQDTPYNIYHRPQNIFTAKFIGSPPMNIAQCECSGNTLRIGDKGFTLSDSWVKQLEGREAIKLGVRPENTILSKIPLENGIPVTVKYLENHGNKLAAYFNLGDEEFIAMEEQDTVISIGDTMYWQPNFAKLSLFDVKTENNIGYPKEHLTERDAEGASWTAESVYKK